MAVITNDIYTKEDARMLIEASALPEERILGVETGGCPHTAIRDDISMNLEAVADLEARFPELEFILIESGGDNLTATFSPELADIFIYVIDVTEGGDIPRKGGPAIVGSDLLVINKAELAPYVEVDLESMHADCFSKRSERFHFSKAYRDEDVLGLQLVNPTAGLFSGDDMALTVEILEGAQAAIGSPSASRFYDTAGGVAGITQEFKIGHDAWLEYHSNWIIPHQGSSVTQRTVIEVQKGGSLLFCDRFAPGRVKSGEQYRYQNYTASFQIRYADRLCVSERMVLEPEDQGWPLAVPGWEVCFYGAVWLVGEGIFEKLTTLRELEKDLLSEQLLGGVTQLTEEVAVFRVVAARSLFLKDALERIRAAATPIFPILKQEPRFLKSS